MTRQLEYNGEKKSIRQWADTLGMNYYALRNRYRSGWGVEEMLTVPVTKHNPKRRTTREKHYNKRYSVYYKKDETPLIIYATSKECAKEMGVSEASFYSYCYRTKKGSVRKWLVYEDEMDDE